MVWPLSSNRCRRLCGTNLGTELAYATGGTELGYGAMGYAVLSQGMVLPGGAYGGGLEASVE
eukprot:284300-Rhodomonas_salina.1